MLRFLSDEDFNNRIVRGLLRRLPNLDIVRVQDVGLMTQPDTEVLERAAQDNRILLTHDVATMKNHAVARFEAGLTFAGIFEVPQEMAIGQAIEELVLLAECSLENEWENQFVFLPLK